MKTRGKVKFTGNHRKKFYGTYQTPRLSDFSEKLQTKPQNELGESRDRDVTQKAIPRKKGEH